MEKRTSVRGWFLAIVVIGVLFLGINGCYVYGTGGSATVTVERLTNKITNQTDTYLVFTDKGVYQVSDSWLRGQVRSSDLWGSLKEGKRYRIDYFGWRVPLFSWYPTIYDVVEEKGQ